ncbi:MAG: class I SAM-dependent methyltransferase [Candidatus Zhuqueibacterota bacterium]
MTHELRESVIHSAIRSLDLPPASVGLDAGCGIGLHLGMLSRAIGDSGVVAGLDITAEFLDYARQAYAASDFSRRMTFQSGSISALPFRDASFDWALSIDCVGYGLENPLPALRELRRVLKPGGTLAVLFWSSQQLFPGYPLLEARLNATRDGMAPFRREMSPATHPLRLAGRFQDAGFGDISVRTFAGTIHAPLSETLRIGLIALFRMRWQNSETELSSADQALFHKLTNPESPDFILNIPDYYAFFTYSMFSGAAGSR